MRWWEQDYSWRTGEKENWKWRTLRHSGVHFTDDYVPRTSLVLRMLSSDL